MNRIIESAGCRVSNKSNDPERPVNIYDINDKENRWAPDLNPGPFIMLAPIPELHTEQNIMLTRLMF